MKDAEHIDAEFGLQTYWKKLPIILRAVISGIVVTAAGTLPWAWLVSMNTKHLPSIPWSVLPAAFGLWLFWRYFIKGKGWPRSTSLSRKIMSRGNFISGDLWGSSLLAGILGLVSLIFFSNVWGRLVKLPQQDASGLEQVPPIALFFILLAGSAVAGIVEETGFRGYMQKPIEQRYGPLIAILITGMMFGLMHFSHAETTFALMPFYFFVAAVYGMLAFLTNSILPGMLLHTVGNVFAGLNLFARGQSEWAIGTTPPPLIWESGTDISFWLSVIVFFVMGSFTFWAYIALGKSVKKEKGNLE